MVVLVLPQLSDTERSYELGEEMGLFYKTKNLCRTLFEKARRDESLSYDCDVVLVQEYDLELYLLCVVLLYGVVYPATIAMALKVMLF